LLEGDETDVAEALDADLDKYCECGECGDSNGEENTIGDNDFLGGVLFLGGVFFLGLPFLALFPFGILSHLPVALFLIVPTLHILTHLPVIGLTSFPSGQDFVAATATAAADVADLLAPFAPLFIINIPSI